MQSSRSLVKAGITSTLFFVWIGLFAYQVVAHNSITFSQLDTDPAVVADFGTFINSIQYFYTSGNLYPFRTPHSWTLNGSQPTANLPFLLLAILPFKLSLLIWYTLSLGLLTLACNWVWKIYLNHKKYIPWQILLIVLSSPFFMVIQLANWGFILTFCVIAAWYYLRQGQDIKGGIFLALGLLIRFHPIFILLFLLVTKRWKAAFTALAVLAVTNLASLLIFGFDNYVRYFKQGVETVPIAVDNRWEHSLLSLFQNIVSLLPASFQPDGTWIARILYYIIGSLIVILVLLLSRRLSFDSGFNLCVILGLLLVIPSWTQYELLLLPSLALTYRRYPWIAGLAILRIVAHNSSFLIRFGDFATTNFVWTVTFIAVLVALATGLYKISTNPILNGEVNIFNSDPAMHPTPAKV